jgi:hypothetical protein
MARLTASLDPHVMWAFLMDECQRQDAEDTTGPWALAWTAEGGTLQAGVPKMARTLNGGRVVPDAQWIGR